MSKYADAWAAVQQKRLMERRNMIRQRLQSARETGHIDPDEVIKRHDPEADCFD